MKRINFLGNTVGTDGYSSHCRSLVNALFRQHKDIHLKTVMTQETLQTFNDAEMKMVKTPFDPEGISVAIGMPHFWNTLMGDGIKNFIGFCVWEGDAIPKFWIKYMQDPRVKQIWVPSLHTKQAIENTINKNNLSMDDIPDIKIVSHGVDIDLFKPLERNKNEDFTFVANKGWAKGIDDRGGIQWLIKAYMEEFTADDKVALNIKINPSYCGPGWDINNEIQKLNVVKENMPKMSVNHGFISPTDIAKMYQNADVFVSATMGEGFNLPGLEAMSCGLPTIQTGFGGQVDYMTERDAWYIDFDLVPAPNDIMYEEVNWAKPDIEHLKKLMRNCYENRDECAKRGKEARTTAEKWTWDITAKNAIEFLKEI